MPKHIVIFLITWEYDSLNQSYSVYQKEREGEMEEEEEEKEEDGEGLGRERGERKMKRESLNTAVLWLVLSIGLQSNSKVRQY